MILIDHAHPAPRAVDELKANAMEVHVVRHGSRLVDANLRRDDVPAEAVDAWHELEQVAESLEAAAKTLELAMGRLGNGMAAVDTLATWALTKEVEPDGDYVREAQQAYELLFPGSTLRW